MKWNINKNDNNPWGSGGNNNPWGSGNGGSNNRGDFEDSIKKARDRFGKFKFGGRRNFSIFFVIVLGLFFFIPNFISKNLISFEPKRFTLGLDLQGGSYLLLEIDTKPILEQTFQSKIIEIKKKLRKNKKNT